MKNRKSALPEKRDDDFLTAVYWFLEVQDTDFYKEASP